MNDARIIVGSSLDLSIIPDGTIRTCVTSPPYYRLRDYGHPDQIGLEPTTGEYISNLVEVFREVRRVLTDDGTLWLNIGDSYSRSGVGSRDSQRWPKQSRNNHLPPGPSKIGTLKNLLGIPWRVAFALQDDGWNLRSDIIWAKPNPMPESVLDRPTSSHEYLFLLTKSTRYHYDAEAIKEPSVAWSRRDTTHRPRLAIPGLPDDAGPQRGSGPSNGSTFHTGKTASHQLGRASRAPRVDEWSRNKRDVWNIPTEPSSIEHFAVMPKALVVPCVLAGSEPGDTVLDPFSGAGTVGVVALRHGRDFVGVEVNPEYAQLAKDRIEDDAPLFNRCSLVGSPTPEFADSLADT